LSERQSLFRSSDTIGSSDQKVPAEGAFLNRQIPRSAGRLGRARSPPIQNLVLLPGQNDLGGRG
jgi:hypothetical protein